MAEQDMFAESREVEGDGAETSSTPDTGSTRKSESAPGTDRRNADRHTPPSSSASPRGKGGRGPGRPPPGTSEAGRGTPIMDQYWEIKKRHPDDLVFFHLGDFFELFFDDAVKASRALDIALTKRGQHRGEDIPMCGVPVHSSESYLARLVDQGFRVVVVEQSGTPSTSGRAKGLIQRKVRRIVTSGTLTEDALLDARRHNYLAGVAVVEGAHALAWLDISTGVFFCQPIAVDAEGDVGAALDAALTRIEPGEILIDEGLRSLPYWQDPAWENRTVFLAPGRIDPEHGRDRLQALYGFKALDAFGQFTPAEIAAAGALVDYVDLTQSGKMPRIASLERFEERSVMTMDATTIRNLELFRSLSGERRGSLVAALDRTRSAAGGRLLREGLASPWADPKHIETALDRVDFFLKEKELRHHVEKHLSRYPDLERSMARLSLGRGSPRDLGAIRDGIALAARIITHDAFTKTDIGRAAAARIPGLEELRRELARALLPELPLLVRDGGFIAQGYDKSLDQACSKKAEHQREVDVLCQVYIRQTGLTRLKIRDNRILGRFIEVPASQADRFAQEPFIHRQTMAGSVRFTTEKLALLDREILHSSDRAVHIEAEIFGALAGKVLKFASTIAQVASDMARIDVACAAAAISERHGYCRPTITTDRSFVIEGGRHPVVEQALKEQGEDFIANDCRLDPDHRIWLLTGPNMAGKSTFLRQNALIAVMAQAGWHVPASRARIGVIDRLFSRVGAGDDLARGRSTFMVEMSETAAILNRAGEHSFVILDEVGRGTATFDGLSIAWAGIEHLHEINHCRTLFATHYHELTALSDHRKEVELYQMRVREWQGDIVFLHEVTQGAAAGSYGIHVAGLAGMPERALARAKQILAGLEQRSNAADAAAKSDPKDLARASALEHRDRLCRQLARVDPDTLNPRQALDLLYRLSTRARGALPPSAENGDEKGKPKDDDGGKPEDDDGGKPEDDDGGKSKDSRKDIT